MPAVVRRPGPADRLARSAHPDQRRQLQHGRLDHRCCSLSDGTTLLGESLANNAESSPWILITDRAVASSASSRALAASNSAVRRLAGSAGFGPRDVDNACNAPRSRCLRHSVSNDEYRPSRRINAPLPFLSSRSYSARTSSLYWAVYVRRDARSGTCGSGTSSRPTLNGDPAAAASPCPTSSTNIASCSCS